MRLRAAMLRLPFVAAAFALALLLLATSSTTVANSQPTASASRAATTVSACRVLERRFARVRPAARSHRLRTRVHRCRQAARRRALLRRQSGQSPAGGTTSNGSPSAGAPTSKPASAPVAPAAPARPAPIRPAEPPPTTSTSPESWNGFGAGSWPDAEWRPYADSSPFNQPIPSGVTVHPSSAQIVQTVLGWDPPGSLIAGSAGTSGDYGHPTYYAQTTDPLYTLHATDSRNEIEGMRIPVPAEAEPAGGGDGHMTIVTPDGWEYDLWQVDPKPAGGGTLTFAIGGRTRVDGLGLDSPATASNFANIAGVIRAQELAAGEIDHALFIVVKCTTTDTGFGYGTQAGAGSQAAHVYPASHGGAGCGSADNATAPPMGTRFQLAMTDAQIDGLAVPAWKKTIARALAHYGGYVGDTGGPGFGLQFESSTMYTVFGEPDPLVAFAQDSGIRPWNGLYAFNLASGIDWAHSLRVVVPPGA